MSLRMIPNSHRDLLSDEKRAYAVLATIMPDGTPHTTPIWFNTDGEHILINSTRGRVKDRNMRENPNVALCIVDPENPYRYLQVRGKVVQITEEGARNHIDVLAGKYTGVPDYQGMGPGMVRVIYKIEPEHVSAMG